MTIGFRDNLLKKYDGDLRGQEVGCFAAGGGGTGEELSNTGKTLTLPHKRSIQRYLHCDLSGAP